MLRNEHFCSLARRVLSSAAGCLLRLSRHGICIPVSCLLCGFRLTGENLGLAAGFFIQMRSTPFWTAGASKP